jgi:hypothetical protein
MRVMGMGIAQAIPNSWDSRYYDSLQLKNNYIYCRAYNRPLAGRLTYRFGPDSLGGIYPPSAASVLSNNTSRKRVYASRISRAVVILACPRLTFFGPRESMYGILIGGRTCTRAPDGGGGAIVSLGAGRVDCVQERERYLLRVRGNVREPSAKSAFIDLTADRERTKK